jgi:hypothetical protein
LKSTLFARLFVRQSEKQFAFLPALVQAAISTFFIFLLFYLIFLSNGSSGWTNPILLPAAVGARLLLRRHETGVDVPRRCCLPAWLSWVVFTPCCDNQWDRSHNGTRAWEINSERMNCSPFFKRSFQSSKHRHQ